MRERGAPLFYILVDRVPVAVSDIKEYARWEVANGDEARRVAFSDFPGGIEISTVFLGFDHNFWGKGPPILFETMIFGGEHDGYQERCATWEEAEAMHTRAFALVQGLRIVS